MGLRTLGASLRRAFWPAVSFVALAGLTACAVAPRLEDLSLASLAGRPQLELTQTPFYPQELHQCGPAALATVLGASGQTVTPETLADEVYIPGRNGSLQVELLAAARRHQRVAVQLAPKLDAVLAPLLEQRPVLLLQNLGFARAPRWHYAVLVGWDAPANELILRSGGNRRERLSLTRFVQTWDLGGRWAVVMADPRQPPPQSVTARDWIAAIAPLESQRQLDLARTAYEAATQRWPSETLAWQALANARYALGDLPGAEAALQAAVDIRPDAAALNNLAQVRIERGCAVAALQALQQIAPIPPALASTIADTRRAAEALPADAGCR